MELGVFLGTLGAVLIGNGLTVGWAYAIFWGDAQTRRGKDESTFPLWFFVGAIVPPVTASACVWVALY